MPWKSTLSRARRLFSLPPARRALLLEALRELLVARLQIACLPFPRIASKLGPLLPPGTFDQQPDLDPLVADVAWAIDRCGRYSPLPLVCLPRALAGYRMLVRRGMSARLHFGALRGNSKGALETHAWLDVGGSPVTGYPEALQCSEIGYYTPSALGSKMVPS